MIEKMQKYAFLVYHKEYEAFLENLREKGVVHVELTGENLSEHSEIAALMEHNRKTTQVLKQLNKLEPVEATEQLTGDQIIQKYDELIDRREQLLQQKDHLKKQISQLEPLGQFDPALVSRLNDNGYYLHIFHTSIKDYSEEWEELHDVFRLKQIGSQIFFVVVSDSPKAPDFEIDPLKLPDTSLLETIERKEQVEAQLHTIQEEFSKLAAQADTLQQYELEIRNQLDFSKIVKGSERVADATVAVLEGWVPVQQSEQLEAALSHEGVFFEKRAPEEEDKVPIKLKNNKINQLFEMIGELYSLPNYNEIDLTPFVAFFYWMFFGFCLGDAGYGLLFVGAATFMKKKQKENAKILTMVQLLGLSTIIFGLLTGTAFGINLYGTNLPGFAQVAAKLKASGLTIQNLMFVSSLGLGLIQILLGMFINATKITRQKGIRHALSVLGWAFLIIFSGVNYLLSKEGIISFGNIYYYILAGSSLFAIFFLNSPGKNPFYNFGVGLWDAYNTVVGGVGDLLSYVRLFALGLATAILGLVFNELGTKLFDPSASIGMQIVGIVLMLFVLLIGHSINIFMSGLGSMVHPLRLTFVEFYKNAGFEGGGVAYKPFKK
ncbi:MAG: V-type ATP synthase subunit I [Bacteroidales bacterium]|nr:V-type ATP synthase subunit I [Bacteroidales bacterium]